MAQRRPFAFAMVIVLAASMALAITMLAAPSAQAHEGEFEHADAFEGTTCPAGYTSTGSQIGNQIGCMPDGYSPIGSNIELCAEAPFGVLRFGTCTYDRARPCDTNVVYTYPIGNGDCLRPALALNQLVSPSNGIRRPIQPVCIEDDLVQTNAQSHSVGERFDTGDGVDYLIVTGGSCTFNCIHGWDINCDGKIGDFCNADYDRNTVAGAGLCLADIAIETAAASS